MNRVLLVHNYYRQPGGEDESFEAEAALLEEHGHEVTRFVLDNHDIDDMGTASLAGKTIWNRTVYRELRSLIRRKRPDVVHFHNSFPLVSPSAFYAARTEGVPVVKTLRNYRLACPNAYFYRNGHPCEDCMGRLVPWPALVHACYRENRRDTLGAVTVFSVHRAMKTWTNMVNLFVTTTEFARKKLIQSGLPSKKFVVKPNFLQDPKSLGTGKGRYALYVGRLSPEKGIDSLLAAWRTLDSSIDLKIVGDGPSLPAVMAAAAGMSAITRLPWQNAEKVHRLMGDAYILIFPSEWYETFGRVIMESFAVGTPVIAAKIGAAAELVTHRKTGLHFRPGDAQSLVQEVGWAVRHPEQVDRMRKAARAEYEAKYTPEINYHMLSTIYEQVVAKRAE